MKPSAVGAGIGFQPIGMTALHRLGLLETIEKYGARIDGIRTHSVDGRPILDVAYKRYDSRLYGLGLHRGLMIIVHAHHQFFISHNDNHSVLT
jgi:2-polyprenyl-6-methoxyphenol hydroxylase-like FAD-dependent oxidoreductase